MKIGSLFSGYGGLDMAVQAVFGGELEWWSDIEPASVQIMSAHHPGVPNLGDITKVDWANVPPVDILTGGYPCQPFSHAGLRKGTNDHRHLWPYVREAISALRPQLVVLENVRGHLSLGLDSVLGEITGLGYDARWGVVRASDAGAPHGRARIFIVAHPNELSHPARRFGGTWPGWSGVQEESEAAAGLEQSTGDATPSDTDRDGHAQPLHARTVGSLEGATAGETPERQRARGESHARSVSDAPNTEHDGFNRGTVGRGAGAGEDEWRLLESEGCDSEAVQWGKYEPATDRNSDGGTGDGGRSALAHFRPELNESEGSEPEGTRGLPAIAWGKYEPAIRRWEALTRPAPAPTVPGRNDRPRLNPVFVEWMMGLPEGHVTGHGLRPAQELKALGNGVCPQQAELALRMLVGA